jgi:hypothetical protein
MNKHVSNLVAENPAAMITVGAPSISESVNLAHDHFEAGYYDLFQTLATFDGALDDSDQVYVSEFKYLVNSRRYFV